MYRRAFSTLGCAEFTVEQVCALAERHSVKAVELRALGGMLTLPAYLQGRFESPAVLAAHFARQGLEIASLDTSCKLIGPTAADRAELLAYVPWAEGLGVRRLRVFDGGDRFDETALAQAAETLAWWRDLRRERGVAVDLMVETHDLLLDAARIQEFIAAMPGGGVSMLWDAHHTWKKGGEDPLATWRAIRPHVGHIHLKDSVGPPHAFTYVLPGTGEFPMERLRAALADEFAGVVSLEWERFWHPYLPGLDEALACAARQGWW